MFRVLVLARTQEIAKEAASWTVSGEMLENTYGKKYESGDRSVVIRAYPLWVGMKGAAAVGDVVLIVAKSPDDLPAVKPLLGSYKRIPLKFVLYDEAGNQADFEAEFKAAPIVKGVPLEFIEKVIDANNDLVKLIAGAFKNYDKNNNGFIELGELQALAKNLGTELTTEEAKKMIKTMDVNKDGKISLDELIAWWKSGFRGSSQQILSLMKKLAQTNIYVQRTMEILQHIKPPPPTEKSVVAKFGIYLGTVQQLGISLELTALSKGKELETEFKAFAEGVGVVKSDIFAGIYFGVKNPQNAVKTLEEIVNTATMLGSSLSTSAAEILTDIDFKYGFFEDKAIVCTVPSVKGSTDIAPFMPFLEKLSSVILPNQSITLKFGVATDLEKLSIDENSFIDLLFNGVLFEIIGTFNPYLKERIMEICKAVNVIQEIPPAFQNAMSQGFRASSLISMKGEIAFDSTPELKELFRNSEMKYPTPVKALKEEFVPQMKESLSSLPILEVVHAFLKDEVNSINILVYVCDIGAIRIRLNLPGLSTMLDF
eukprot:TRINITY_DN7755_c0_g1_i1.p1 TRINITY_DN7755_c0_g1~~TRINITY_DN7755_c0_g1_i1.p1  ORF type:complete len:541 (-),score=156.71 TRINITY_DN7755_c0_g1_i1:176-1798(-)